MNNHFFENAAVELDTAAKDFQRVVNTQIAAFTHERELHEKTVKELERIGSSIPFLSRKC